jgi:hypothetical protein
MKPLYLMIDFSNGGRLLHPERDFHPSLIMGLRFAYAYFLQGKYQINYSEFLQSCLSSTVQSFTLAAVMAAIHKDFNSDELFVIFHIDEVQVIFDFEQEYKWETNPSKKGLFKLLM